jgi:hypothetical protein
VARKADETDELPELEQASTETGAPEPEVPVEPAQASGEATGMVEPLEGETMNKEDRAVRAAIARTAPRPAVPDAGTAAGQTPLRVRANLHLGTASQRGRGALGRHKGDTVTSTLDFGSSVTQGGVTLAATSFGEEAATYKADNITWTAASGTVDIKARIFVDCKWDTQDRGRTDISGPADGDVTKASYPDVVKDLKPDATGRPTRDLYWAKDLTERHEKFHAADDIGQAKRDVPTVKTWMESQSIAAPATDAKVKDLVEKARKKVEDAGWAYYDRAGGAGENRAYADGKASYQTRVDDVNARAVKEKW